MATSTFGHERFLPLDLMRGVAAMMVAMFHVWSYGYGTIFINHATSICVPFFFVLSGFVLSHAYGHEIATSRMGVSDFAIVRFARLYPLHFVTFAFVVALWSAIELGRATAIFLGYPDPTPTRFVCTWTMFFEHLSLTQQLFAGETCFNNPSWSIGTEWWCGFYLFALLQSRRAVRGVALLALVPASMVAWQHHSGAAPYTTGVLCFALGWVSYRAHVRLQVRLPPTIVWSFAVAMFAVMGWGPIETWPGLLGPYYFTWYAIFAVVVFLLAGVDVQHRIARLVMTKSGDWSYGIYLWHVPLIMIMLIPFRILDRVWGWHLLGTPIFDLLFYPILIALAAFGYQYIELPAKRAIKRAAKTLADARTPEFRRS
jgi:peptidoglycan/LPS O-acetylase OafA/YrhL